MIKFEKIEAVFFNPFSNLAFARQNVYVGAQWSSA